MSAPTMEDVAARAGVSRALVSLVMRNSPKVSPASRSAVLAAAAELGYRPNAIARHLASSRTTMLGVLLSDIHNPFFAEIYDGADAEAVTHGYRLLLGTGSLNPVRERDAVEAFLELRVDALVLAGPRLPSTVIAAAAREVPVALVSRLIRADAVDTVVADDRAGAGLAVRHLASLGHRRIAHVDGGAGAGASARRTGYQKAMTSLGLQAHIQVVAGDFTEVGGAGAVRRLLQSGDPPTAIFAANDLSGAGALDAVEEAGLRVPDDISVVGYDNTALAALHHVSMTTINQPREEMGRLAVRMVLDRVEGRASGPTARRAVLTPDLVVRRTTAVPRRQVESA